METLVGCRDLEGMEEFKTEIETRSDTEARIIAAARNLFIEHGFSAVSGDRLCKEARVSKTSLYKYFGDMTGVLAAVVMDEGDLFELRVVPEPETADAFWEALIGYGARLLTLLNRPFCIQLDRILHEEARANPGLAEAFYENAYGRGYRDIKSLIASGQRKGFIERGEPAEDLADHLLSMWEGLRLVRARLGLVELPFEEPDAWSRQCVKTLFAL
ncbi:MAG: TetR/AcrR family transcriptional regulator [Kiloniellales bacterium]